MIISRKAAIIHTRIFLHPYNLCHAGSPRIYCIYEPMPRCLIPSYPVPSAIFITHTSDSELNCIRNVHGAMCGPSERSQHYCMILLFSFFFRTFWFSTIAGISPVFLDLQINAIFSVATSMALDLGCFIFFRRGHFSHSDVMYKPGNGWNFRY